MYGKEERTDSAAQSLVLLNGPQFVEAARATAEKLIQSTGLVMVKLSVPMHSVCLPAESQL